MTIPVFLLIGAPELTVAFASALEATGAVVRQFGAIDSVDPVALALRVSALDRFDAVVLLPGWRGFGAFVDSTDADWDAALSGNFTRTVYVAQAAARRLVADGQGGNLIFVTSHLAMMPFTGAVTLGTTLAMVHAIARMAAVDLGPHGITSNVIAPGWTDDETYAGLAPDVRAHILAGTPVGRPTTVDEVAALMWFLASDAGRSITGAILPVDGGYTLTRSGGRGIFEPG